MLINVDQGFISGPLCEARFIGAIHGTHPLGRCCATLKTAPGSFLFQE
jgi:hypothetical protein